MNKNKFLTLFLLSVIALFYSVPSWGAAAWYVKPGTNATQVNFISTDIGGGYDNSNWSADMSSNPATSLSAFINNSPSSGDVVYIYSGDYGITDTIYVSPPNNARSLEIYGGFVDTDTSITSREHQSKIITSQSSGNVIDIRAPSNTNLDFVFDGFYISSNNNANNGINITPSNSNGNGNSTFNARIENCTITAMNNDGIYAGTYDTVNTVITNCTLNNNGGYGIYYNNSGTLTLEKSTITGNQVGVFVNSNNTTITNCTIANNAQQGITCGTSGSVKVVNSTIVNNVAEIYFQATTSFDITNTLIWNDSANEVFNTDGSATPTVTFTNSAYPNGAKKDYVTSSDKDINIAWANIVSADETVKGVKHTFYSLKNNLELIALIGAGVEGQVSEDQLGRVRAAAPTIGAIETEITGISAVVSPDNYTAELKPASDDEKTFTVTVSEIYDDDETTKNEISSGYTTAWSLSKSIDGITIDNDGVLKIANTLSAGTYEFNVIAAVTHAASGLTASDDAAITITKKEAENASPKLISLDVTLSASPTTLSLDAGTEGKIVVTPTVKATYDDSSTETLTSGYEITWTNSPSVEGITLTSGTLNVTSSTKAGNYEIKITATVTSGDVKNSADTTVTINVNEVSTPSNPENPENPSNPEKENENGKGQQTPVYKTVDTQSADGIKNLSDDAKAALIDLTLTGNITDLTMIDSKFVNLKIVNLSKVTSLETADLSQLPASVESVDISNNVDLKVIKLTATTKIKNVIANGCKKLEKLDLAKNPNIEVIDVSETGLKEIDATNCENLMTIICSSCDIDQTGLILTGCAKLVYLDFSKNSFLIFDFSATDTPILETLKCEGQNKSVNNIPSEFNFAIFMSADKSNVEEKISASENDTSYAANIKNLTAKDVNGNPIEVISQDLSTGYVKLSSPASTLTYDYVTGFNNVNMGVTINAGNSKTVTIGNSGGGCNLGLSGLALIAFAIMLKKLR